MVCTVWLKAVTFSWLMVGSPCVGVSVRSPYGSNWRATSLWSAAVEESCVLLRERVPYKTAVVVQASRLPGSSSARN